MIVCIVSYDSHYTKSFLEYWKLEGPQATLIRAMTCLFGPSKDQHQAIADEFKEPVWNCQQSPQLLAEPK